MPVPPFHRAILERGDFGPYRSSRWPGWSFDVFVGFAIRV